MTENRVKKLVLISLFAALTCVATMIIRIPSPTGGYINTGDTIVLLSAFILGPIWGAISAAVGSAMADIFSGYPVYAAATFIIKGLMALVAGVIYRNIKTINRIVPTLIAGIIAEAIMVLGYLLFTATVLGFGAGAIVEVPGNLAQGVFGLAAGTILNIALCKVPYVEALATGTSQKSHIYDEPHDTE